MLSRLFALLFYLKVHLQLLTPLDTLRSRGQGKSIMKYSKKQNKILGIITARGGSKRLPRKNVKDFLGKPLLAWTIEIGKKAKIFDRFILTTDDDEIAKIGKEYGVEVPFKRPPEFAQDTSSSYDTIRHAVEWLRDNSGYSPNWLILFEPTSPGRQPFHIKEVAKLISKNPKFDSLIGISETPGH